MTPKAQLQQEANKQVEYKVGLNLLLKLGLYLLNLYSYNTYTILNKIYIIQEYTFNYYFLNSLTIIN